MPTAFPPAARLHRPSEYAAALRGRRVARGKLFVVSRAPAGSPDQARLGLVVPKRQVPLAVGRNTIKRVVREAFRLRRAALPPGDWVFRLVARPSPGSLTALRREVRGDVEALLERVASC